jgi:hypothetical protein
MEKIGLGVVFIGLKEGSMNYTSSMFRESTAGIKGNDRR